jgi:hypothetical protein
MEQDLVVYGWGFGEQKRVTTKALKPMESIMISMGKLGNARGTVVIVL